MFRNLLGFLSSKGFLEEVLDRFSTMLQTAEKMYGIVVKDYFDPNPDVAFKQSIYDMDKEINEHERAIRKRIVEHLSVQPRKSLTVSLVLMSVVKDAERIGDFIKNMFEVGRLLDQPLDREEFAAFFSDLPDKVSQYFSRTVHAFVEYDEEAAGGLIREERALAKQFDDIIVKLAKSNLNANRAVCFTMTARFLKRISLHLGNIATAVIVPVSNLDYFDERFFRKD